MYEQDDLDAFRPGLAACLYAVALIVGVLVVEAGRLLVRWLTKH